MVWEKSGLELLAAARKRYRVVSSEPMQEEIPDFIGLRARGPGS